MMKNKELRYLIYAVVLGGVYFFWKGGNEGSVASDQVTGSTNAEVHALLQDEQLVYTKHAKCRMDCRYIDKQEVEDILRNGKVNWQKTRKNDQPCPSYALEGKTKDGQQVRIVFADCNNATKVVTAIDLGNNYNCVCD
ncbi:MAG: DUF4258 domain-containing protein [Saprospiraceae bacterium]|nr:DUF4258 domain-containing protein [Saprospiraceae bacterium]